MLPLPVVEHLDVRETGGLHVGMGGVLDAMHPLVLEAVEPAFRRCVVPAVDLPAHRAGHAVFLELVLEGVARILAAAVGMMQPRCRSLPEPGHGQRIRGDVRRHARFQGPAHDLAVEQVENDGQVEPAFVRPQIRDVRRPRLIRRTRREVAIQQVFRHRQAVFRVRRHLVAPVVAGTDAMDSPS